MTLTGLKSFSSAGLYCSTSVILTAREQLKKGSSCFPLYYTTMAHLQTLRERERLSLALRRHIGLLNLKACLSQSGLVLLSLFITDILDTFQIAKCNGILGGNKGKWKRRDKEKFNTLLLLLPVSAFKGVIRLSKSNFSWWRKKCEKST